MHLNNCKLLLIIFLSSIKICAQLNDIKFERVLTEKGASNGTINYITKDNFGFIWLATNNGLLRYDGYNFKEFKYNPADSNSISGNQIWCIKQDSFGDIWVGTSGRGLNKYSYKENRFIHYRNNPEDLSSLGSDLEVTSIIEDNNGTMWIALWEWGFDEFDRTSNKFIHYKHSLSDENSLISNSANRIFKDSKGFLWIGTSRGLSKFDKERGKFKSYKHNPSDKLSIAGNYINSIIEDKSGNLWIGTYGGLSKYDYTNDNFVNYLSKNDNQLSISSNAVMSLCEDSYGNLWVGTDGGGLNYFDVKKEIFVHFYSDEIEDNLLSVASVPFLFMDDNSILWIGTVGEGLFKVAYGKNKFSHLPKLPVGKNSLSKNEVSAILESKNGNLWIGTPGSGLFKYNFDSGQYNHFKKSGLENSLISNQVSCIIEDNNNNLWIGTDDGLCFFDVKKNKFSKYLSDPDNKNSISDNKITSLLLDKRNNLWIGTNGGGLNILDLNKKNFIHLNHRTGKENFPSSHVWVLFENSKGDIWIGTWGMGAIKYNYRSDTFTQYNTETIKKKSVILNVVVSIAEDKFSNIWLGTWGNGLYKLYPDKNEITAYGELKEIPHENIYGIIPDSTGNLWISSGNGLSLFNPNTVVWKNFDEEDGLQSLEFRRGAACKGKSGKFYFGGVDGLNYFQPENIKDNKNIPPVVFTSFKIFEKEIMPTRFENNINLLEQIILPYNENFISFEFSALEFTNPKKNQYLYMLKGIDKDFIKSQDRRYASYPDLEPGEYIFTVKGSNNDGIWNNDGRSILLIINPPFWRTWWAYILYAFIVIISLYYIRNYELNKRRRKEEETLRKEKEQAELRETKLKAEAAELKAKAIESEKEIEKQNIRYRIAADLHDEIGSNLSSITLISSILTRSVNANDGILNKLADINVAAKSSVESIRDIVWFINPMSDQLGNLISKINETANSMLGNINYEIITDVIVSDEKINPDIKRNIYLIYKEILNNIIKHSKADKVNILIKKENQLFSLSVEDNGIGFEKSKTQAGNGLRNIKTRIEQIKGELILNSINGKGTAITIKVNIT